MKNLKNISLTVYWMDDVWKYNI